MSFDKEKLRRAAEKNLAQGKIQAAIKDFCQLAENDQRDYNTLNTLGDLYARVEAKDQAIDCFTRIAEYYASQGFVHKAIAMYKKIARLKSGDVEISAKLAPLYQTLGLVSEARTHFLAVADAYQKKGDSLPALEIWQQIADLDPNDTNTRLNLAESYLKENQIERAVEAFAEAGERLLVKKQWEPALTAFTKSLNLHAAHLPALHGATAAHIALGFPDEAIEKLEKARTILSDKPELFSLMAQCYLEMDNAESAEFAIVNLVEREPANYKKLLDVTRLYVKSGDLSAAVRTVELCGESLLSNGQETDLEFWLNEILTRDPEHLKALQMLARLRSWQRNELELKDVLERLAEAARLGDAFEEEKNALSELRMLFPQETRYSDRLFELTGETGAETLSQDFTPADGHLIPSFESFSPFAGENEKDSFQPFPTPEEIETTGWSFTPDSAFKIDSFESFSNSQTEADAAQNIEISSFEDSVYETAEVTEITDIAVEFVGEVVEADTVPENQAHLLRELESVDFYIVQGYNELALESLCLLEKQFGAHSEIEARLEKLQEAPGFEQDSETGPVAVSDFEITEFSNGNGAYEVEETVKDEFIFDNRVTETFPAVNEKADTSNPNFADLMEEFGEEMYVGGIPDFQTADYETHYNLGLAYKEMGLYDEAVEEFQMAVKIVAPEDGTARYLQCCNLIGHCFVEKGMPELAVKWYQRGLDAPGHTDEEYQALRYELGTAFEKAGEKEKAIAQFTEIYSVNVAYRSVGEKLRTLQA